MPGDALQQAIADALARPERIRGEDGREVEERPLGQIADAIALISDLEADAAGTRQNAIHLKPAKRRM